MRQKKIKKKINTFDSLYIQPIRSTLDKLGNSKGLESISLGDKVFKEVEDMIGQAEKYINANVGKLRKITLHISSLHQ